MLNELSIEILRRCPNNCIYCSSDSSIDCKEIISFDRYMKVVDSAVKLGLKTICLSGGEPFLHPQIIDIVDYALEKNLFVNIYTSGIFMNKDQITSIPYDILNSISTKNTKLIFNIEAADKKNYNYIMGTNGNFNFLKQSIIDSNSIMLKTEAHFVPMKLNIKQIDKMITLCKELGISKISFLRLVLQGRALKNQSKILLTFDETKLLKEKLFMLKEDKSFDIRIGVPLLENKSKLLCTAAREKINIKYDGSVYPCEVFKNSKIELLWGIYPDNIFDKDLEEIYYNSLYLKSVREYINNFNSINTCENCIGQYLINYKIMEYSNGK